MTRTELITAAHEGRLTYTHGVFHHDGMPLDDALQPMARGLVFAGLLLIWGSLVKVTVEGRAAAGLP